LIKEEVNNLVYNLLLVDDEKPIREKLINNTDWTGNDYQVFAAADGAEALEIKKIKE
jgi:two-component system response regulator YesN